MARSRRTIAGQRTRTLVRVAIVVAALAYAIEGGEYGTSDLLRQRSRERALRAEIDSLSTLVDSLGRFRRRVATDLKLQERIAREEFGFVHGNKELLYRFAEPDTSEPPSRPARP